MLMSIALLTGIILVVGLGERLDEVVAFDSLFYIQESDTYVRAEKAVDSSAVYLYFCQGKEPDADDCGDVVRIFGKQCIIDAAVMKTKPERIMIQDAGYGSRVISRGEYDLQLISTGLYFSRQEFDENKGFYYQAWKPEEIESFRDSMKVAFSLYRDYTNCITSTNGSLYGQCVRPVKRTEIKRYQTLRRNKR